MTGQNQDALLQKNKCTGKGRGGPNRIGTYVVKVADFADCCYGIEALLLLFEVCDRGLLYVEA